MDRLGLHLKVQFYFVIHVAYRRAQNYYAHLKELIFLSKIFHLRCLYSWLFLHCRGDVYSDMVGNLSKSGIHL